MRRLLIVGCGRYALECYDVAESMRIYDEIIIINYIISDLKDYLNYENIFIAIKDKNIRNKLSCKAKKLGFKLVLLISPFAYVSPYATLLNGIVIFPYAYVGANVILWNGCIIDMWSVVEDGRIIDEYEEVLGICEEKFS